MATEDVPETTVVTAPRRGGLPPLAAVNHEPTEPTFYKLGHVVNTVMRLLGSRDWRDQYKMPAEGGIIIVVNHTSHFDPLTLGHYVIWSGRWPRYMGKIQIFTSPWIGWLARACGQIPVDRGSMRAADSLRHAEQALAEGKAVTLYPEGTLTGDPDGWPMTGRTGAARLALTTGAPVIPIGQWGAQEFMPDTERHKGFPIRFWAQPTFTLVTGDPVDLSEFEGRELSRDVLAAATVKIMDAITALVEQARGEKAPADRWDFRAKARVPVVRT